jgi:hypothetical protein
VDGIGKENGVTWYDVLGLLPGASSEQVKSRYDAKASLLRPEHLAGAPSPVVAAASRARDILDSAQRVLADPANRARYDEAIGIRRSDGGLQPHRGSPSEPGWDISDAYLMGGHEVAALLGGLLALADSLGALRSHPGPPRRVAVPDVRGLFYSTCSGITGKLGFRLTTVRLTERPLPVDGLVIDQSPKPAVKARRGSVLTVQVWHPPAKLTGPRP